MPEEHRPHTASYLILEKEEKVALLLRDNTGYRDGEWTLISGHVDEGENFKHAMMREAKEEAGIEIDREILECEAVVHRNGGDRTYVDIYFRCRDWKGQVSNEEPEKHAEIKWFRKDDLPEKTIPFVRKVLQKEKGGTEYMEIGWKE